MADQLPSKHTYAGDVVNVETHHEESDVNVRALIWFMVVFIVFAVVMHVAIYLLYRFYRNIERGALLEIANVEVAGVASRRNRAVLARLGAGDRGGSREGRQRDFNSRRELGHLALEVEVEILDLAFREPVREE